MPKGIALTLGLNSVDPAHYGGWSGELNACEADALDMADLAQSKGFTVRTLLTKEATRQRVLDELSKAAASLQAGDIFMLSYSGHGGQLPDLNQDEALDAADETWCLFDGEIVDDELYKAYGRFAKGVRILVFSDSCHSGTVTKLAYYQGTIASRGTTAGSPQVKYRFMPPEVAARTYRKNQEFYNKILSDKSLKESRNAIAASVLLISGCQDNQLSMDGTFNGLFTSNLLQVWNQGRFKGSYRQFHRRIVRRMPPDQTPNYYFVGAPNAQFEAQSPFTI